MVTTTLIERLMALFTTLVTLIGSFSFSTNFDRPYDEIKFTINANTPASEELPNVVTNTSQPSW